MIALTFRDDILPIVVTSTSGLVGVLVMALPAWISVHRAGQARDKADEAKVQVERNQEVALAVAHQVRKDILEKLDPKNGGATLGELTHRITDQLAELKDQVDLQDVRQQETHALVVETVERLNDHIMEKGDT